MKKVFLVFGFLLVCAALDVSGFAQMKARDKVNKNAAQPSATPPLQNDTEPGADFSKPKEPQKKNQNLRTQNRQAKENVNIDDAKNLFTYEYSQPDFLVKHIVIKHDENGKGTITFEKRIYDGDPFTDPIQISKVSLEKIKNLFQALNFLDSKEEYQSTIHQYPHLGTMKISLKQDGRQRITEFNWSENQDAKALADEYKKVAEQYIWMFDVSVSLQNQPLEAPGLMDKLDTLLRINQISDPTELIPFLKKLGDDERIPLIARNHAVRIAKEIEKKSAAGK